MKNFFKNLKNLITRHKLLSAIVFLTLVVLSIFIVIYIWFRLVVSHHNAEAFTLAVGCPIR